MSIARKPVGSRVVPGDEHAEQFIARAEHGTSPLSSSNERDVEVLRGRVPTMVRFDRQLLAAVDAAARRRGVSRSAWIQYTLSQSLEEQG